MYVQALAINDKQARENAERHARNSESAKSITAMLTCAEYQEGIPVLADQLDRDPYLLNCLNGTLNLRSGLRRKHRREDLITKLVHFDFDPQTKCPLFLEFLYRIMGASSDASLAELERASRLVSYLQKCFGYSLTGDVSEKVLFILFGSGNNGKTTLLEAIRFVIAEYSTQVLIDSLMRYHSRESNASLADLADLRGARLATTSEAEEGQRLAVGKLKYLSQGMGKIKTCRKYENPMEFTATHKLFLDANHKPVIQGAEKAVWNRLKPIPFTVTIPDDEIDKGMLEKLKGEAPGILAWQVEGCQRWKSEGLGDPPEVAEASAAWRAESDRFPAFLEEKCVLSKTEWVRIRELWSAYLSWCAENHERGIPRTSFDERLESLGCKKGIRFNGTVRAWIGIQLRTENVIGAKLFKK
jgi:putative DNA primase/helicase